MDLTPNDRWMLKSIFAPEIVAVPPENAHRDLCRLPDGEIRFYGQKSFNGVSKRVYISSLDAGLSWKTFLVEDDRENGAMVQSPWSGDYITVLSARNYNVRSLPAINDKQDGVYVIRSAKGPGSNEHTLKKISGNALLDIRQPIPMRSRRRWLCTMQKWEGGMLTPVVLLSDDDGENWREVVLTSVPPHRMAPPHKGMRWQQYSCEPTVVELDDGRLMLISRTSQDVHYVYYSGDAGETWTAPVPSEYFHATTTMPTLLRLGDGRIVFFWCNTQPLPELDHATQPELSDDERSGVWEDVFTNRDACHAAISSDDGQTWAGFREINLNEIRNFADYRSVRGSIGNDKSVHQFEALELPEKKILLAFGQAPSSRRLVLFDPEWLYETERTEDFKAGLENVSTHVYVKSLSGGHRPGGVGHCAWNRTNGALLVPNPDGTHDEVLLISRVCDERLFNEVQGVAWNFPAGISGTVSISLRVEGEGIRVSLTDRWFNPCDVSIAELAQLSFVVDRGMTTGGGFWSEVDVKWDLAAERADVFVNGRFVKATEIRGIAPAGFSYLHLQSTATDVDCKGAYVRRLHSDCQRTLGKSGQHPSCDPRRR